MYIEYLHTSLSVCDYIRISMYLYMGKCTLPIIPVLNARTETAPTIEDATSNTSTTAAVCYPLACLHAPWLLVTSVYIICLHCTGCVTPCGDYERCDYDTSECVCDYGFTGSPGNCTGE